MYGELALNSVNSTLVDASFTKKVTDSVSKLSSTDLPETVEQQHSFAITVAENFVMNIGTLRGENSIHMLNRIIIQTPENDELKFDVSQCVNDLCVSIVSALDDPLPDWPSTLNRTNSTTCTASTTTNKNDLYTISYKDESYRHALIAYGLMRYSFDTDQHLKKIIDNPIQINVILLAGFASMYLPDVHRPLSKITFLPPINEDPNSLTASQLCFQSVKTSLIDSHFQKEAVVVVDEKIYRNCAKFISIPSDNAIKKKKEEWFSTLINEINTLKLSDVLDQWAAGKSALNQAFQFWYFIYRKLLELLILLYMSIRLSNFDGRNAALYSMAPIFFATNHRNYARLLERSFAVNRTNRTFSAIALDQTIEYSINKYGKDLAHDNKDLPIITNALHEENIFNKNNAHVRQIMNDKVIHEKIIANVVTMYERGLQGMHSFLQDWYVDHSVNIDDRLSVMLRYKLSDSYLSNDKQRVKKRKIIILLLPKWLK
ncbi:unnamed protein product [Rotaria magnacalcarata]|uniref:Uncharacterized protein n=1 Tax=Rotaria magnacalcarata TaxID=392030 RepID=A0A814P6T7_9BILA|nr:unnamed protein product [Rotaria magnacalcarata]